VIFSVVGVTAIQVPETVHNGHGMHSEKIFCAAAWSSFFVCFSTSTSGVAAARDLEDADVDEPLRASLRALV